MNLLTIEESFFVSGGITVSSVLDDAGAGGGGWLGAEVGSDVGEWVGGLIGATGGGPVGAFVGVMGGAALAGC